LTMDQAVRNGVTLMGSPLKDAVRMASETPDDILGVFEKGRITPGADADLVILSPEDTVYEIIVAGQTVYDWRGESHVR
jgi:N-acetylglucosamine-6-phosphate deacetylase